MTNCLLTSKIVDRMNIEEYLRQLGLGEKEIKVYLASLKLGEKPIMPITKKAELPRSTVYHILEKLRDAGLVEIIDSPTRRIYIPFHPRVIITLLNKKRDAISKQVDAFQQTMPKLIELYSASEFQPKIKFYRGTKEIRELYNSILEEPIDEFHYVSEITKIEAVLGRDFLNSWLRRRIDLKIKSWAIWVRAEAVDSEKLYKPSKQNLRTVRYAPEGFRYPAHTIVFGDTVAFITTSEENIGVAITSRDLAVSYRNIFKQLWKVSEKK